MGIVFPKNTKKLLSGWKLRPQTLVCDTVRLHNSSLLNMTRKVRHLNILTINLSPLSLARSWLSANRPQLQIFHSTISLPHKKFFFSKFLMTLLQVICGLDTPSQKFWLCLCIIILSSIPNDCKAESGRVHRTTVCFLCS